ncbi:nicotinate-nucleotide adenylyltransferase [Symbiobacterium terraclitae]|uniref:Probable nicotinate-nucleotide adenylyltransferase n=1 Tax=Symbiobacterium terraclitae TaxID=557451 RepID=A0ABS4JWS0_9FIRM|nr:nicotinate-nucleotide adenylyltransferase [Symbiobacterium terraclitae]
MARVAILGGTFDPIHLGHLAAAQGVLHLTGVERVVFMPNRQPPHKEGQAVTPAVHRTAMVRLAIAGNPDFAFSDLELRREGPSYTIETVRALQAERPDWQASFIIGMDSLLEIRTWREYETLLQAVDWLVVTRPGYDTTRGRRLLAELGPRLSARVRLLEIPGVAVSSTHLRQLAARGYPLRYLVPDEVAAYIEAHGLYRR